VTISPGIRVTVVKKVDHRQAFASPPRLAENPAGLAADRCRAAGPRPLSRGCLSRMREHICMALRYSIYDAKVLPFAVAAASRHRAAFSLQVLSVSRVPIRKVPCRRESPDLKFT
jgi:hypothetical protein